jgi:amino acid transporter
MTDLEKQLKKEYRKKFTVFPHTYFCFGILMALIAVISLASMSLFPTITALTSLACIIMLIPTAFVGEKIYMTIRSDSWRKNKLRLFKLSLLFLPLLIILIALFIYYSIQTTATTAFFFFALLACIGIFKTQLRTRSSFGTSILDNIEGYKLYLSSQDNTLLSTMRNATSKIKALYGKHLPFAVALDLEQLWTRRFIAFSEGENQLKPDWYKGKLPFTEDFIKSLFIEFNAAFPKKDTKGNRKKSSRFKKDASNIDDKKNTHV